MGAERGLKGLKEISPAHARMGWVSSKKYDEIEESELGLEKIALQKLLYLISFWYIGRAATQEEFSKLLDAINKDGKKAEK